jgi:hypothetical protein
MGTITINIISGQEPFLGRLYLVSNPPNYICSTIFPSTGINTFENVPNGEYNVWIRDNLGCISQVNYVIIDEPTTTEEPTTTTP